MPNITVSPVNNISVRVNQGTQTTVPSTAQFFGSSNVTNQVTQALNEANAALIQSNAALIFANSAYNQANLGYIVATSAYNQANIATTSAQASYNTANTSLLIGQGAYNTANTSLTIGQGAYNTANLKYDKSGGTISGDVTVTGNTNIQKILTVGVGAPAILPNLIGQFTGTSTLYTQINNQNLSGNGTSDVVITANNGTDSILYLDMGMAGSNYQNTNYNSWPFVYPNDGYLMLQGNPGQAFGGNIFIGTAGSGQYALNNQVGDIVFIQGDHGQGTQEVARFKLNQGLIVETGVQSTSNTSGALVVKGGIGANGAVYADSVYDSGIRIKTYVDTANTYLTNFTQTSYNQANSANILAQSSYNFANTINVYAYSASAQANSAVANTIILQGGLNTANANISVLFGIDATQNTNITNVTNYATSGYAQANAANVLAQAAFNAANSAGSSTFTQAAFNQANSANVLAQSSFNQANSANVLAQAAFNAANNAGTSAYTQAAFAQANSANVLAQSSYNFANTVNVFTQSAYNTANTANNTANVASANITILFGIDAAQNTTITSAFNQANAANILAQSSYNFSNTVNVFTQSAYNTANTANNTANVASANITVLFGIETAQNTSITAAFNQANAANVLAQSSYNFANTVNTYAYSANTFLQANDATTLASAKSYTDTANTGLKSYGDATYFAKAGGTVSGNVTIQQNLTVQGNVSFTGNVISYQITGNTGQFFGYTSNGFNALYAGIPTGYLIEPQMITQFTANYNGYAGVNHQNINSGANSSTDIFLTPDNGTSNDGFLDIGVGSSTYSYPGYNVIGPNDGYFIVAGNTTTGGGKLILSTALPNDIVFTANGTNTNNEVMRITAANTVVIKSANAATSTTTGALRVSGGVGVQGDVQATNVFSQSINLLSYSGLAYNQANAANILAQSSYNFSNTVNTYAYSAYSTANSAQSNTIVTQGVDSTQNTWISSNAVFTQSSFNQANSANVLAQSSYNFSNTVNTYAYSAYSTANSAQSNTVITQGVDSTQNTWISSNATFTQSAYAQANSANVLAQSAFNQANSANVLAQAAFNKANTGSGLSGFLANSIIFANSTGYLSNTSNLQFINSNTLSVTGLTTINYTGFAGSQQSLLSIFGANTKGGIGYVDFLQANNTSSGANNTNKYFRLDSNGQFQIINSAYSQNIFNLNDSGYLSVQSFILNSGGGGSITFADGTVQATAATGAATDSYARQTANSAYAQANSANVLAQAAFNQANSEPIGTSAFSKANSANVLAQAAFNQANSEPIGTAAFSKANSANVLAQAAFNQANNVPSLLLAANTGTGSVSNNTTLTINGSPGIITSVSGNTFTITNNGVITVTGTSGRIAVSSASGNPTIDMVAIGGLFAGTYSYPSLQVDSYGRITTISNQTPVTSFGGQTGAITLSSANVTTALGFVPADSNSITILTGVNSTQNTWISSNAIFTQSAYTKANGAVQTAFVTHSANGTSVTPSTNNDTLSITASTSNGISIIGNATSKTIDFGLIQVGTAGTYGNSTYVPVITTDAFGRVTAVTNTAISASGGSSSGYLANSVIFANTTGYLSNSSQLQFLTSNNTLLASNIALPNGTIGGIRTATFNSQPVIATTTGAITIDWTTAQNQKQTTPTGSITYTFTAPPNPCHHQLLIDNNGSSSAQVITWPGTVIWLGSTWSGVNNKKAVINFWYDGTNYYAIGTNQV